MIRVQLPEAAPLARPELGELLLPDVERRVVFTQLATDIGNGRAAVRLVDGIVDQSSGNRDFFSEKRNARPQGSGDYRAGLALA